MTRVAVGRGSGKDSTPVFLMNCCTAFAYGLPTTSPVHQVSTLDRTIIADLFALPIARDCITTLDFENLPATLYRAASNAPGRAVRHADRTPVVLQTSPYTIRHVVFHPLMIPSRKRDRSMKHT